jgi:hypothetical protein
MPCGLFVSAHAAAIASQLIADSPADGDSGGVQLWNVADRQPLGSRRQIAALLTSGMEFTRVMAVQFSPDGTILATGMNDGTENCGMSQPSRRSAPHSPTPVITERSGRWRSAQTVPYLCKWAGRSLTAAERTQYAPGLSYRKICS